MRREWMMIVIGCLGCSNEPEPEFVGDKNPWPKQHGTQAADVPGIPKATHTIAVVAATRSEAAKKAPVEVIGRQELVVSCDFVLPNEFEFYQPNESEQVFIVQFSRKQGGANYQSHSGFAKLDGRRITFSFRVPSNPGAGLVTGEVRLSAANPANPSRPLMRTVAYTAPVLMKRDPAKKQNKQP